MTWRDFKAAVERLGVRDDSDIEGINTGAHINDQGLIAYRAHHFDRPETLAITTVSWREPQ